MNVRKISAAQRIGLLFILAAVPLVYSSKAYNFIQIKEVVFSMGIAALILSMFFLKQLSIKKISLLSAILPVWFIISTAAGNYKYAALPVLAVAAALVVLFIFAANTAWTLRGAGALIVMSSLPVVVLGLAQVIASHLMRCQLPEIP